MTISAIGGCSPTQTQATQYSSTTNTAAAGGVARDGSTFINAIASALSDIGVTASSTGGAASATGATTDATTADPAKALGSFLQTLMQTLHSQAANNDATATQGAAPAHAHHGGGKGGHVLADLKSLIASLGSASTDATAASSTADLAGSFKNLLGALGVDSADSGAKLGQFLQTLSAKLESSGPSGNLVSTTA